MTEPAHNTTRIDLTFALGALAGVLLAQRDRKRVGSLAGLIGLGLIGAAVQPVIRNWVVRHGAARRRVRLRTTIQVARAVPDVFAFCKDFENFPRIVGSLRRVTDFQDGRSHWEAYSPSGEVIEWDALVTKYVPNAVIAWSSVPASSVVTSGIIRFAASGENMTRLTIELMYLPRDGGFTDALHALASPPRQKQLLADIDRASFYIESLPAKAEPADSLSS